MRFALIALVVLFVSVAKADIPIQEDFLNPPPSDRTDLSFNGGVGVTNAHYFRGFLSNDKKVIVQPYLNASYQVYQNDDAFISGLSFYANTWNSVETADPGSNGNNTAGAWFESDLYGGARVDISKHLNLYVGWAGYISPSDAFNTVQEVDTRLVVDDNDLWKNSALGKVNGFKGFQPYVMYNYEIDGHTGDGINDVYYKKHHTGGMYLEFGVQPGVNVVENVRLSLPARIGFGLENYYNNGDNLQYGYTSVGPVVEVLLTEHLSFFAGLDVEFFSKNLEQINHNNHDVALIGSTGFKFKF